MTHHEEAPKQSDRSFVQVDAPFGGNEGTRETGETPEQAYRRLQVLDNLFDRIESILEQNSAVKPELLRPMLRALNNDAGNGFEGWGERLFFFLRGLHVAGVLSDEKFQICLEGFEGYDETKFHRYTKMFARV